MKLKSKVRAGKLAANHNQSALTIKTNCKAGKLSQNHNQSAR